jgi:hypothetical protein
MPELDTKETCTFGGCVLNAHFMVLHPDPEVRHVGYACYKHAREHDYRPFRLVPLHPIGPAERKLVSAPASPVERSLVIGSAGGEHLRIVVLKRAQSESDDFWEGNWLDCAIDVSAGGFQGAVNAPLRADELFAFRLALVQLQERLAREALFETSEEWLSIRVVTTAQTRYQARCELRDAPNGNRLSFSLVFSREGLNAVVQALDAIQGSFPVVGR